MSISLGNTSYFLASYKKNYILYISPFTLRAKKFNAKASAQLQYLSYPRHF